MPNLVSVSSYWELESTIQRFKYQKMGKGRIMPKENLTALELLITKLQKVREDKSQHESNRLFAASLLGYYAEYKSLTHKQRVAAHNLVRRSHKKKSKPKKEKTYYLYAMVAGTKVKLGYTCDIKKRRKQLQTANAEKIVCVWSYGCGKEIAYARANERKLHRFCKEFQVQGEWFSNECLPLVKKFKVK